MRPTPGTHGSASYTVDSDAISGHGTDLGDLARDIRDKMALMQRKLNTLQGQWTGSAANQYATLYDDWSRQASNVRDSLDRIGGALGKAADHYRTTEQDVRRTFTQSG